MQGKNLVRKKGHAIARQLFQILKTRIRFIKLHGRQYGVESMLQLLNEAVRYRMIDSSPNRTKLLVSLHLSSRQHIRVQCQAFPPFLRCKQQTQQHASAGTKIVHPTSEMRTLLYSVRGTDRKKDLVLLINGANHLPPPVLSMAMPTHLNQVQIEKVSLQETIGDPSQFLLSAGWVFFADYDC